MNYNNGILVANASDKEHLETHGKVFAKLQESGLKLKESKCSFMLISVEYLGHCILRCASNTSIVQAPAPANVQLRSFLGLVNYYGKFLPQLASTLSSF